MSSSGPLLRETVGRRDRRSAIVRAHSGVTLAPCPADPGFEGEFHSRAGFSLTGRSYGRALLQRLSRIAIVVAKLEHLVPSKALTSSWCNSSMTSSPSPKGHKRFEMRRCGSAYELVG